MFRWFASLPASSTILTTALFLAGTPAANGHGSGGHGGGGHGGASHHGGYHHGFYGPYHAYYGHGFYWPYYGNGFGGLGLAGFGLGLGAGLGLAAGGYGLGGYGLGGGYGPYLPYGGGPSVVVVNPPVAPPTGTGAPAGQTPPPPDNAAHLQFVVPANAEVLFDGEKTTQAGPTREFVSPPLTSGKVFNYTITVRYTNAEGKPVNDKRVIYVRANDWFRIDFTRPAPPEQAPPPRPE
jgi:uncharacterized protein (TIGR03000 family)